ncbi:hypothetical protein WN943_014487 [Citrus x changshan-huyou]
MGRRQQDGSYNADEMETATPMRWKPQWRRDGSHDVDKMEAASLSCQSAQSKWWWAGD